MKIPTLSQQMLYVKNTYDIDQSYFSLPHLFIKMHISPTAFSLKYPITVKYHYNGRVEAWVTGNLERLDDPDFPHHYGKDLQRGSVKMCLYLPGNNEWDNNKFIADRIIPWISDWLYYYELWVANGEWYGGGEHPEDGESK